MIYDDRKCELGEGPLWHPGRSQLFWFDILNNRMMSRDGAGQQEWHFSERVSAAGWVDDDTLLIASETALSRFDLRDGSREVITPLEADRPETRSNDGRADPQGGFWIGTMGKQAQPGAGSIWRYYRGELRRLFPGISISNAISFPPDGRTAHFADTAIGKLWRVALDAQGWPVGKPELFLDLVPEGLNPDGAVVDAAGLLWLAQWGAGRVAAYAPDGALVRSVEFEAPHTSCPAFGGPDLTTLFCTSAQEGLDPAARAASPNSGKVFATSDIARGQPEHRILL
ncbi:SMP-30/gluconolactonase/LRE family protein [Fuscibacter oryzae]|uniref:SMP-30/gluconolactonase/LRE family protein n=1 Tax=Fuscibacter oryzae TaxID=2803939 RepID=A0A8J7MT29_9RHOB|nr:SMP-30/gluconolactonase/LRE family protein [Fuscibacter oryzae]MBL4930132.1 SMP-30/gluconolactonase/LRE family protein [Fuscibacter oryzae]